jgi:hypothetical protein
MYGWRVRSHVFSFSVWLGVEVDVGWRGWNMMPPSVKGRRFAGVGDEDEEGNTSAVNFSKLGRGKWLSG